MAADILVVDDEDDIRELVAGILEDEGYAPRLAGDSDGALTLIEERRPNLVFLDIWLQGSRCDGLSVLDLIKAQHPDLPVVMISGHGNIETAVSAIKRGAYDFIEKPFNADRLLLVAERALEASKLKNEVAQLKVQSGTENRLIGNSLAMLNLRQTIARVAPTNSRILITGTSGSGKELVARAIHAESERADDPFVVLNAAAMTVDNMPTALFGNEPSASSARVTGALEQAHGGTLYLDEIAEMPRKTQAKILRVLVDQRFTRVGGSVPVAVDVRIISSTARSLEAMIAAGKFREDLFHRLSVIPVAVPSLAERREDIPELVEYFVDQISRASGLPKKRIADDAMAILQTTEWPGNIRQLRNNVERLLILTRDKADTHIDADHLPKEIGVVQSPINVVADSALITMSLRKAREVFEREYLSAQVKRFGGNISRTATFVGMERSALHRKLKALDIRH